MLKLRPSEFHEQLSQETSGNSVVIDVRSPQEYASGHLPGAINFPLEQLKSRFPELESYACIYVHCKTGYRSEQAGSLLERLKCPRVVNLLGGLEAWRNAGFSVEV
jgi:hydroxyacylglutathione hydrolase